MKTTEQLAAELAEIREMRAELADRHLDIAVDRVALGRRCADDPAVVALDTEARALNAAAKPRTTATPPAKLAGSTMWDRSKNFDPNLFY